MSAPAWPLLEALPAWEITEIPRPPGSGPVLVSGHGIGLAAAEREKRRQSLSSACRAGAPAAFAWIRVTTGGPVRVVAAGAGLRADEDAAGPAGAVLLGYPAGSLGQPLPPGGLAAALTVLPCWVPVAITPDALLDKTGGAVPGAGGPSLEDGFLRAWRGPFGWLVLAVPAGRDRHAEMLARVSLDQLMAQRHDSPRAQLAGRRAGVRHEELRAAAATGLWDIWLLAGAATPNAAARVTGLLTAALDLRGLPFGLSGAEETGPLPKLLGAPDRTASAEPGPLARDILAMHHGQDGIPSLPPGAPGAPGAPGSPPAGSPYPDAPHDPGPPGGSYPDRPYPGSPSPGGPYPGGDPAPYSGWGPAGGRQGSGIFPLSPRPEPDLGSGLFPGGAGPHPAWRPEPALTPSSAADGLLPEWPDPEPQFPCAASSLLLAALAVPPAREVPGVRLVLQPGFDVTPETAPGPDGIRLGTVLDATRSPAGALTVTRDSLNRHTFVCGATGSGKSQTVRHLLESAAHAGIPWLVIEPAKAEYKLMAARLPGTDVIRIKPGDLDVVPAGLNPLEPAEGPRDERFPLQAHADLVRVLFLAAFQAEEPFPQILAAALTRCYTEAGWDLVTGEPAVPGAAYPALGDLQAAALVVVEQIGYSREITENFRGFVSVRIGSLRGGTTGRFLDGAFPLDYTRLLAGNVVLEIEDCGDDTDKAFLTGAILIRLTEHLRLRARAEGPRPPRLRHLTVIEEAHRLLRQPPPGDDAGPASRAVEMFAGLLAEIRAYGEGLVIAEQIPAKLIPDAIKNTAVKVVHRLPAKDDRDAVGATMNLTDEQSEFLVTLVPGEAAVFADGMDYPVLARMPDGTRREEAAPASPKTAVALVTRRSTACPRACGASPCSLGRIAAAQRALAGDRAVTMWAELTVAAHLAGWPSPSPGDNVRARLANMDPRLRDCTLARAIDDAVTTRIPAFSARVAGPVLAAHAAESMLGILESDHMPCDGHEPQWFAPAVAVAGGAEEPWDEGPLRDSLPLRDAVLGTRSPSPVEKAAKTWAHDPDFAGRLAAALASFPDGDSYARLIADVAAERG